MIPALLTTSLKNNAFFSGGAVLMAMGGLMAYLRALPQTLWRRFIDQVSVEVTVDGTDASYGWLLAWLNQQPYSKRSRRLSVQTLLDGTTVVFTPAKGQHIFRYRRKLVWLSRGERATGSGSAQTGLSVSANGDDKGFARRLETIYIRVLGRSQEPARELIEDARAAFTTLLGEEVQMFRANWDYWSSVGALKHRALDSVILPEGVVDDLVQDVREFLDTAEWYRERGIPYRRGYLLHGLPGTGKSSLVAALACALKLPLYSLNLGSTTLTDDKLQALFHTLPERCILLMEDVDATSSSATPMVSARGKRKAQDPERTSVTLSGLLNVLDGVGASEGRLLFMTTNHREALDPALIRPGRVDIEVEFGKATGEQVQRLYQRFYEVDGVEELQDLGDTFTMAELQGMFLLHRSDPVGALERLQEAA